MPTCTGYLEHPFLKRKRSEEKNQTGVIFGKHYQSAQLFLTLLFCRLIPRYMEEQPKTACRGVSTHMHQNVG
jgi:hypothetical protein